MDALPYELLQLIAGNLLPRYQCRLGLTSSWCYKYLYNDLLRWHARKSTIPIPKYRYRCNKNGQFSLREINNVLICCEYAYGDFTIHNLTSDNIYYIYYYHDKTHINITERYVTGVDDEYYTRVYGVGVFDGFYKYMHRYSLRLLAIIRCSALLSLPSIILGKIMNLLSEEDLSKLFSVHHYLHHIYHSTI